MMKPGTYLTIETTAVAEYKVSNSKFLAYAYPFPDKKDLKKYLDELKKAHHKAVHFCFAYRVGVDKNDFRVSDNGEPSGTAGRPILGQIDKQGLTDILIVVVRYFGGTLLGVAGLTNAYKTAAALVIQLLPVVEKAKEILYKLEFPYELENTAMQLIKKFQGRIIHKEHLLFATIQCMILQTQETALLGSLQHIPGIQFSKQTN